MVREIKNTFMKKIVYILLFACSLFCFACNESTDIDVLMPTLEVESDGGSDIEFTPEELKLAMKKGACFTLRDTNYVKNMARVEALKVGWNYSWGSEIVSNQLASVEFLPMSWGRFIPEELLLKVLPHVNSGRYKRFLGFNEPDGKEQANMTVEKALELWPTLQSLKIPLGSPAVVDAENGEWIEQFMAEAEQRGYRVDYLCVHNYGGGNATEFKRKLTAIYEKYNLPILITEFAVADWNAATPEGNRHSDEKVLSFMKEILPWLEETEFIYGYAWFSFGRTIAVGCSSALFNNDNTMTELGKFYANFPNDEPVDPDPPIEETNLLLNPGFEESGANWVGKTNVNYDNKVNNPAIAGNVISGDVSLRFSGVKAFADISQTVAVEKGKTYRFGFTGRIQDKVGPEGTISTNRSFKMVVRKDKENVYAESEAITGSMNVTVSGEITIGDNHSDNLQVYIAKMNGIASVDDVFFVEVVK